MLGNLGFTEIAILLLILVLFFGAKRIPEIGASIGKGIKEFKRGLKDEAPEPPADTPLPPSQSAGPIAPSSSGMMRRARCLYRSPPPSDESMCQIVPCVNTLCSSTGRRQLPRAPARPRPRAVHRRA